MQKNVQVFGAIRNIQRFSSISLLPVRRELSSCVVYCRGMKPIRLDRHFSATAAPAAVKPAAKPPPSGIWGFVSRFIPKFGQKGFTRKVIFILSIILVVNGLVSVGYYTMDRCYNTLENHNGEWLLANNTYRRYKQFEIILNFPLALDFVFDPAPLPPPASSAYISITQAPAEKVSAPQTRTNPFERTANTPSSSVSSASPPKSGSTLISSEPILPKPSESLKTNYAATTETIMPFVPIICVYFGNGVSPQAIQLQKHRDLQDYLHLNQLPWLVYIGNSIDTNVKWEHRGYYGALLFKKYLSRSFHANITSLDYSDNALGYKSFKTLLELNLWARLSLRKVQELDLSENELGDRGIHSLCQYIRAGGFKRLRSLKMDGNKITEKGIYEICILIEEGYLPKLTHISYQKNNLEKSSLAVTCLESLIRLNNQSSQNVNTLKRVDTYILSDQLLNINSKVILQMLTKLSVKWSQLSKQMLLGI